MINILEITVQEIRKHFERGELTSSELVRMYLERIATIDRSGPKLNSILEVNPDALHIAAAMDRERSNGKVRSALHGIPVLLKDNINTADKMRTTSGSMALADNFAPYDATVTSKIRDAGLVIMGKTNMTEFANYMSYNMKNGYSSRGGQVINPYNPQADVWGSSSGAAVAVSANLCSLSVGTETDGSIIWPSHINGTVGIKPTLGLVSRYGILPICTAQDTAGPMTRCVADSAELLNILVGEDPKDPATWARQKFIPSDYTKFLLEDGLTNLRIGINRGYYDELTEEQVALCEAAIMLMAQHGAQIVQDVNLPKFRCDEEILLYEFKKCLNAYLATVNTQCRSLSDIIDFYNQHEGKYTKYGMDILTKAESNTSGNCTEFVYLEGRLESIVKAQEKGLGRVFEEYQLDVLLCPGETDHAPISGFPAVNVPIGFQNNGVPFGLSFVGLPHSEPVLIQAAYAYEQASKIRKPPIWD